jgi:hypothetical protein
VVIEQITMGEGPGSESDPNKGEPINFDSDCTDGKGSEYLAEKRSTWMWIGIVKTGRSYG